MTANLTRRLDVDALRHAARRQVERLRASGPGARVLRAAHRGDVVACPCCASRFARFKGYNGPDRVCWVCGSFERHRSVWLHLDAHPELLRPGMAILHVAPEPPLRRRLAAVPGVRYVSGDLLRDFGPTRLDVTALEVPDASFDAVVCNHVLEHVPDDRRAMAELRRVLRPGGWALLLVPDVGGPSTDEEPGIADPEEQLRRFGQRDHVRRYGWDYVDRLTEAGFAVEVVRPEATLPVETIDRFRLRRFGQVEPLFLGRAPGVAPPAPAPAPAQAGPGAGG